MNVCIATYQSTMLLKGGPKTQILQTGKGLEGLGVKVSYYDTWEELKKGDVDLVHLFGANIGTWHLAREIHKLGIPLVVSPIFFSRHSTPFLRTAVAAQRVAGKLVRGAWTDYGLLADICSWASAVLPNTNQEARLLRSGLGVKGATMTVVPNGVEERFRKATPDLFVKTYGVKDFVLNVGHVGPGRKNVLMLLHALAKINVPSVIIGRIEDNEYGRTCVAEAKKNPRLLLLDAIPNDSELLASAYAACDTFVLPSLFETPGIAALEAALAGAKIVITKYGGTEEYFGEKAQYVEPSSWELIHHGITTALNAPKDGALAEHVAGHFLWNQVARKTLAAYEGVLAQKR
jgi:glycosyltransferase involved in cell wall biosynthesis